ncbi:MULTISPECIES: hypothetical protein [Vibrio harveyi group]|uniref:hypothetical protein n=1 Tax=Vibrio harveyi group TaxID=717610 RepID=UPI001A8C2070|nr:hypothetical protein [Vibrio parahaemolyticus]MBO0188026.1 hypothetical protein [Vibrio parahaemolyticus]MBO0221481.1 hypothetical protein [Vibrio parahaemolyticus]MDF4789529.1 hypothetical protein [Vibrio parahaemolyticus]WMN64908.1 hypothetical protein NI388_07105 [Vibrio parahaemolyticus]WMN75546.1 hypothetical protein NI386_15180 [Vibrio parahaemolyticus]
MNVFYKLWLTFCSLLLTMTVYLVKEDVLLNSLSIYVEHEGVKQLLISLPKYASCVVYFVAVVCCTGLSMVLARWLSEDQISVGSIATVETANDAFLPSYLGYFFVALSVGDSGTFIYVFSMIFIFIFFSKISYFNPVFLIFGYKFFHLTDNSGLKIVVITKKELKVPCEVEFCKLKRINNYTFITSEQ